jgi:hypothetical protein
MTPEQQTPASVVERLREIAGWFSEGVAVDHFMAQSVAAEHAADLRAILAHVERLSAERDGLREALRPFALAADNMDGDEPDTLFIYDSPESAMIDYADLRRARAALTQGESRQTGVGGWQDIATAPRDGRWLLLEGEMSGGDTSTVRVGRWNPHYSEATRCTYEWQCVDPYAHGTEDETVGPDAFWNWHSEGRVSGWQPLPAAPTPADGGGE